MKFSLFGSPCLEINGRMISMGRRKAIALLTYLALTNQPHSRAALATLLWPHSERARALSALRQTLSLVKKLCGPEILVIRRDCLSWSPNAPAAVDVLAFQQCLEAVQSTLVGSSSVADAPPTAQLIAAVDLYQGEFLADFVLPDAEPFEAWRQQQAHYLQQGLVSLLAQLIQQLRTNNQQEQALHYAQRWVSLDPLHEPAQQALLELFIETGQQTTAVSHYQQFADEVKAAYGLQPTVSWSELKAITAVSEDASVPAGSPAL